MVQPHRQRLVRIVRQEVGFGDVKSGDERSCLIGLGHEFAHDIGHRALRPIRHDLDRINEMFARGRQFTKTIGFRQFLNLDVVRRFFALRLELGDVCLESFNLIVERTLCRQKGLHFFRFDRCFDIERAILRKCSAEFAIGATHLTIECPVGRVNDLNRVSDFIRTIVRQPVQAEVHSGIAKEVFLRPSGKHA